MSSFTEVPILDLALARNPDTKPAFLEDLKHALLQIGFLYIKNTAIDEKLIEDVVRLCKAFFDLPEEEKLRLEMKNSPHFLGYSRLGNEITKYAVDYREQIDLATELPAPSADEPRYRKLRGPNQWPNEELIPGFRKTIEEYIARMTDLSTEFTSLVRLLYGNEVTYWLTVTQIAEAIGLPTNAFERFFEGIGESESGTKRQDKLKLVKYPDLEELGVEGESAQGVGPHKGMELSLDGSPADSMLSSYLLQVPPHKSLQVQNAEGTWISCPPIDGTFVVAMGQGLEAITGGVVASTTHRVLSPATDEGPRFSIPFFQGVSYDAKFESMDVPEDVRKLKREVVRNDVEMTFKKEMFEKLGEATLTNRVKSHTDVGEKYYPDILDSIKALQLQEQQSSPILAVPSTDGADDKPKGRKRAPTIVIDKIEAPPSYGEDPGPDGSLLRKEAYEKRKMDAKPDEVRYHSDTE
ncbi:hypothetical protein BDD12DRAFT_985583 [Trichophaea hybrida]|nr:hypothetical protein BDD12DRAFT_985583 [Trichophaea hybrida]